MLDIKFIRENPDTVKHACRVKGFDDVTDAILTLDARVRELKTITQSKTAEKNKITREIPTATDKAPLIAASKKIGEEIAAVFISAFSILMGSFLVAKRVEQKGIVYGSVLGLIYMLILYLISSILNFDFSLNGNAIIMIVFGIIGGAIGGILGVNLK